MWIENTWINLEWLTDITITLIQCFGCMTEKLLIKIISTVFPPLGLTLCPCVKFVDFCQEYRKKDWIVTLFSFERFLLADFT